MFDPVLLHRQWTMKLHLTEPDTSTKQIKAEIISSSTVEPQPKVADITIVICYSYVKHVLCLLKI